MGPMYFTSLRKIQIFGFRIDGIPEQSNFLIDVNETIGKDGTMTHGPNPVLSMIDWALQTRGAGELSCAIHADNCPGQNKNQYGYFMWRVMTGRHQTIEYLMQIPGHARCRLIGSGFATLKKLYRRSDVDSLDQLETVVNRSSTTSTAVRYPSWKWRDWKTFRAPVFRPIPVIRRYQYFRMSSANPGVVYLKLNRDAPETSHNIRRRADFTFGNVILLVIQPGGLSETGRQYLYKSVRPFVRPRFQDVTCQAIVEDQ